MTTTTIDDVEIAEPKAKRRWLKLDMNVGTKLPLIIAGAALLAALGVGVGSYVSSEIEVRKEAELRISSLLDTRHVDLKEYLESIEHDLHLMSTNLAVREAVSEFTRGWNALVGNQTRTLQKLYIQENPNPVAEKDRYDAAPDGSAYSEIHRRFHPWFRDVMHEHGYHDVFLFDMDGNLVYSVFKETDFATNVMTGRWRETDLGNAYRAARNNPSPEYQSYYDFKPYEPSHGDPASFMSTIVLDEGGNPIGVLAVMMPTDKFNKVLGLSHGLGETGEAFLVGEDRFMRNDSRLMKESTVLKQKVDTETVTAALNGESGTRIITGYHGTEVLSSYLPFEFHGHNYALIMEAELEEIEAPVRDMRNLILLITLGSVLGVGTIGFFLARTVSRPVQAISDAVTQLADGEDVPVPGLGRRDEFGVLASAVQVFKDRKLEQELVARDNLRIKIALDNCNTNVMVADDDMNIVYMNQTMHEMMRNAEADLTKELTHFDSGKLMGTNVDVFHKDPSHQRQMIANLKDTHATDIEVAGRTFGLIANPVLDENGNRLGTVVEWDDKTERLAREREEKRAAQENLRIRIALDNCKTNVMVADGNFDIVYMNKTMVDMLRNAESDLKKELPQLDIANLIGTNMDTFHKNPAHQRGLLEKMSGTYEAEISPAGRFFNLVGNPVIDPDNGDRIGTVVEWKDITQEKLVESEVDEVVQAAIAGDFSRRIGLDGKDGFMKTLAEAMNSLSSNVADAVEDVGRVLGALSDGNLNERITKDYSGAFESLKNDANTTSTKLSEIVTEIMVAANEVANAASEISNGSADLSQRTEQQASNLEETAASMEEMASTVKQNAENAQQANQLAISARDIATNGGNVVGEAVDAMSKIEDSSQKISDIIGVIDEIAFQTNLLALNAAVEAARAGDAGKGFAVVASEVRTLAQRSSQAAKDIKSLIVDSGNQVQGGVKLVNAAGESLNEIVDSIKRVTDIVSEIAAASNEQSTGVEQINSAVSQMDEMTQQNSALVEENAAAAKTLEDQSRNMHSRMEFFSIEGGLSDGVAAGASGGGESPVPQAKSQPVPMQKVAAAGGGGGVAVAEMQAAISDAVEDDPDWSEF